MSSDSLARSLARTLAQQNLRGIWEKYYPDAHAVLFLVDSNDIGRMDDARRCLHSVARNKDLDGAPLLVAVNKQDKLDEELRAAEAEDAAGASGGELRYRSVDASANDGGTVPSSSPKGQSAGAVEMMPGVHLRCRQAQFRKRKVINSISWDGAWWVVR